MAAPSKAAPTTRKTDINYLMRNKKRRLHEIDEEEEQEEQAESPGKKIDPDFPLITFPSPAPTFET